MDFTQTWKTTTEILPVVPARMDFGGSYTKWSQQQRKKLAEGVPCRQNLKKKYRGNNKTQKETLRTETQRIKKKKETSGMNWEVDAKIPKKLYL